MKTDVIINRDALLALKELPADSVHCCVTSPPYGCLPLDCECYMLGKCWTGAYCRYFREAVLPDDPVLEAALLTDGPAPETRPCPICGKPILTDGKTRYCSEACAKTALRAQKRSYMRKKRGWAVEK